MLTRRTCITTVAAAAIAPFIHFAATAQGARRLVLVHGRDQQGLDPVKLKAEWVAALGAGMTAAGLVMPAPLEIEFPYYGDALEKLARESEVPLTTDEGQRKGTADEKDFLRFQEEVVQEMRQRAGITDAQIDAEYGNNPKEKGPLNWEWVQAILRALDRHAGGITQRGLELILRDVYLYTRRPGVRDEIDAIVAKAFTTAPCIVVGHSLGSIVTYNILRSDPRALKVPQYVTIGSPLGIRTIRDQLRPIKFPPPVKSWFNAYDDRDVVALYPLDVANFPTNPAIENEGRIKNPTDNRHGAVGYLGDKAVASRIQKPLGD